MHEVGIIESGPLSFFTALGQTEACMSGALTTVRRYVPSADISMHYFWVKSSERLKGLIVPDVGDRVISWWGLTFGSGRPHRQFRAAGTRHQSTMPEGCMDFISERDSEL